MALSLTLPSSDLKLPNIECEQAAIIPKESSLRKCIFLWIFSVPKPLSPYASNNSSLAAVAFRSLENLSNGRCKLPIAGMRTVMSTPRGKCSANVDLASPADALRDSSRVPPPRASAATSHTFFPVCYVAVMWESRAGRIGTNRRCVEILNLFPRWGMHLHSRQSNGE